MWDARKRRCPNRADYRLTVADEHGAEEEPVELCADHSNLTLWMAVPAHGEGTLSIERVPEEDT